MQTIEKCKILLGTFVINFLMGGSGRLSPILFVESLAYYDVDRKQASLPFVLAFVMRNLSGPVMGYLEQIFGIQWLIIFGGISATLGIGTCYFSTDILTITILWGIIFGLGFGLSAQLLPSILNAHFPKDMSKANSFLFQGSSLGSLLLPVLFQECLQKYGMAGSFLILSATVAHCLPAALLLSTSKKSNLRTIKRDDSNQNPDIMFKVKQKQREQDPVIIQSIPNTFIDKNIERTTVIKNGTEFVNKESHIVIIKITGDSNSMSETAPKKINFSFDSFKIFIDPVYIAILVIHALSTWVYLAFWTIILDVVRDKGAEEKYEIYFVICLPVSEMITRTISGYIIDKLSWRSSTSLCACSLGMSASLITFNFIDSYALLFTMEIVISFFISTSIVQQIVVVPEFIEEERRIMGMSCRFLLFAPCTLTISPFVGYFRGNFGSYDYVIYILSGVSLLSCGIASLLPYLHKRRNVK